jgi:WD40 repeat protein
MKSIYKNPNHTQHVCIIKSAGIVAASVGRTKCFEDSSGVTFWALDNGKETYFLQLGEWELVDRAGLISSHQSGKLLIQVTNVKDRDESYFGCYSVQDEKWNWKIPNVRDLYWMAFSGDDRFVIAVRKKYVYWLNAETGEVVETDKAMLEEYTSGHNWTTGTVISQSGKYLLRWHRYEPRGWLHFLFPKPNPFVTVYDLEQRKPVARIERPESTICWANFLPGEKHVAFGCEDTKIRIWSLDDGQIIRKFIGPDTYIVSPRDQGYFAAGGIDEERLVKVWSWPELQLVKRFTGLENATFYSCDIMPFAFSEDGKYFAIELLGKLRLYETGTWNELWATPTCPDEN